MFQKILIANRGEIAVRIIRACREMGIATVAVYSQADREALHVQLADEAVCIGPAPAKDSYLNMERILSATIATKAQAIHPGFGFLSENSKFAEMCRRCNIAFIGPSPEMIRAMGNKSQARKTMMENGISVVPGTKEPVYDVKQGRKEAERIGYPVMIKASSGGGGKGMRVAETPEAFDECFLTAQRESEVAFGDTAMYLERCVRHPRHVEVQILADAWGNTVYLGNRDCSVQRRHQKLIEESPSPAVSSAQREKLMALCAQAVAGVGYVGAGTLEFLLDREGNFWFMEMNVRLQVEHGVTEMLTKIDLVKWQIRAAAGVSLTFGQEDVSLKGAALECRINAASPGKLEMLHVPGGPFVRFDTYLVTGVTVSPYYDSLLGKLVVYAGTREEAVRKMKAALCELVIEGIGTNIAEQLEIGGREAFRSGDYDLTLMEGR